MKNYMKNLTVLCVLIVALFECSCKSKINGNSDVDSIVFELNEETSIEFPEPFLDFSIIPLETKEQCMLGCVNKMKVTSQGIYVYDNTIRPSVLLFDNKGNFVRKIGMQGHGKNEFVKIDNFTTNIDGDTVFILDFNKVKLYSSKNEYITDYILDDEYGWDDLCSLDGEVYMGSYHHGYNAILTKYSKAFTQKVQIGNVDPTLLVASSSVYNFIQHNNSYIVFWDYLKSSFYLVDKNNNIKKYVLRYHANNSKKENGIIVSENEILSFCLDECFIYCTASLDGNLYNIVIDITKDKIFVNKTTSILYNFSCYHEGYIYKWYDANSLINILNNNGDNEYYKKINDAINPYINELSNNNNIYLLKIKLKD